MYNGALLGQVFLILFCLVFNAGAVQSEHQHHDHAAMVADSICDKQVGPSLSCANAPSAVFDKKGRLWLAWAFAEHVYVNYSDDKGKTYSTPVVVNKVAEKIYARGENRPKIVIADNGHIYISWTQQLSERFSGHIRFSRSLDGGKHFSDPIIVNDHQVITSHRFDALAVNQRGDIYLAWLDKRDLLKAKAAGQPYNGAALYYAVSTDGGISFNTNEKISDNTCQCCRVVIAIDKDQLPVVLWRHIFGDNVRDHAMVKFDSQMKPGEVLRVSHDQWQVEACPHHGPGLSIADDGRYHLVWFNNAAERHGLFYANTFDQGKTFSTPVSFGNYKAQAAHAQVLALGKAVFLVWKEFDGKQATLISMNSSDSGKTWTQPQILANTTGDSDHPLLIADDKKVYAVWHRHGQHYQLFSLGNH
ncbi:MAG: glycoside hydrolase [Gammaproteobacteria bacterium]|nr:glycoside hydrolase [Gammaproteobacteria bacterium]